MATAITIGTFDGLHRGHMAVLDTLRAEAAARGLEPMVMTFDRHPLEVVAPDRAPLLLMHPDDKSRMLADLGTREIRLPFTRSLAAVSAADWLDRLRRDYNASLVVIGYDNTFGCDGVSLDFADYRRLGAKLGIEVITAPVLTGVSSSAIRRALTRGRADEAAEMMGRLYTLTGTVVHGRHLGTGLGFPTANLRPAPRALIPAIGVYDALATLPDGRTLPAVVNIGRRPSVITDGEAPVSIEAHIPGFEGDLYGSTLTLAFRRYLRPERRFDSLDQLADAIRADIAAVTG